MCADFQHLLAARSAAASFNVLSIHRQDDVRNVCAFLNYPNYQYGVEEEPVVWSNLHPPK